LGFSSICQFSPKVDKAGRGLKRSIEGEKCLVEGVPRLDAENQGCFNAIVEAATRKAKAHGRIRHRQGRLQLLCLKCEMCKRRQLQALILPASKGVMKGVEACTSYNTLNNAIICH
jgi:hypothetical protein